MKTALVLLAGILCLGLTSGGAIPEVPVKVEQNEVHVYKAPPVTHVAHYPRPGFYGVQFIFHGQYPGTCSNDGFYLNDDYSFVICTNGNSYIQPCAPGTRNNPAKAFTNGAYYKYGDFCNENLNDYGYGAAAHPRPYHYGFPYYYGGFPYFFGRHW